MEALRPNEITNNKTSKILKNKYTTVFARNYLHRSATHELSYLSREADENKTVCVSSISTTHFVPKSISVKAQERQIYSDSFKYEIKAGFFILQTNSLAVIITSPIKWPYTNGHLNFGAHSRLIGDSRDYRLPAKKIYHC